LATILIIDDKKDIVDAISTFLIEFGHQVYAYTDVYDALKCAQQQEDVELVITDVLMPHMNGCELLSQLKKISHMRFIPYIGMSGGAVDDKHKGLIDEMASKVTCFLSKPVFPKDLLEAVEVSLQKRSAAHA